MRLRLRFGVLFRLRLRLRLSVRVRRRACCVDEVTTESNIVIKLQIKIPMKEMQQI